jgi:histone demethylase JARID1
MTNSERISNVAMSVAEDVQTECLQPNAVPGLNDSAELSSDNEFGFYEGKYFILQKFERMAHAFQRKWFTEKKPDPRAVEQEFWRIVEAADENVQVHYGSDLDVAEHSSGFPRDPPPPYSAISPPLSHWNLNHLPRMEGSVLRHITGQISGVTDPMIYVGMLYSSFCWHTEDNYLYSINYLHKGACKTWYGVPASAAMHFENVMKEAVPELFMKHPDLLHLLITMISPAVLLKNNVPIVRTVQEPGQYVITFPQAYHAGFSHGFTCAEAVNFAPADWLPFGTSSVERYRGEQRGGVFSQDQLLCTIAQKDPSPETAKFLTPELRRMRDNEQKLRDNLRMAGLTVQMAGGPTMLDGDPSQCKVCRYDCYLSAVTCPCSPQYVACLHHARQLCECEMEGKTIQVRVPLNVIDELVSLVEAKLHQQKRLPTLLRNAHISSPPATPKPLASSPSPLLSKENSVNAANKTAAQDATSVMKRIETIATEAPERRKEALSTGQLYQNHIPPPPNIPVSTITYTPVTLTDLTTSVPTTVTHYIAKVAPHPPAQSPAILKMPPTTTPSFISSGISKKQMIKEAGRFKPVPVNLPVPESVLRKTK